MPTVVIVGFRYNNRKAPLESTLTDIYIVYSYYRDMGYRIYIGSDMRTPKVPSDIADLYSSAIVDANFVEFINKKFNSTSHLVTNKSDLQSFFDHVEITQDRRLIFYYTGHGTKNNIVLPDESKYPALDLRKSIINLGNNIDKTEEEGNWQSLSNGLDSIGSKIFIILDCCNPHGLYLPFTMSRDNYTYQIMGNNFLLPEVILITSSDEDSKSEARKSYSIFTRELFSLFKDRKELYSFEHVMNTLDSKMGNQKCLVRSSHPILIIPWVWVVTKFIDFEINNQFDVISVKRT
jgi:hypothetical protein